MLVGEAPGAEEDKAGVPFKGRAGRQLNAILTEAWIDRGGRLRDQRGQVPAENEAGPHAG
jgi:uracil-DNA glycosylase family 4